MAKKFNIAGRCIPAWHYMADTSRKQKAVLKMVEEGDYFIINRPRQYGKTTTLHNIADALIASGEYIVFNTSFEGVGTIFSKRNRTLHHVLCVSCQQMPKRMRQAWLIG